MTHHNAGPPDHRALAPPPPAGTFGLTPRGPVDGRWPGDVLEFRIEDNPKRSADRQMQQPQAVTPSSQPLVLRTLGVLGLYRRSDGTPVVPPGKPIALLVYLSALPGRRANREHLLNLLWADREPASARHALRQTTWYLRQRLANEALEVGDDHVTLTAPLQSDRELFLAAVESARVAEAVAIYRGEFLGGFAVPGGIAFEHWAEAERQRLQFLFWHAAESLSREEMERGHFRIARELARRVRDTDPFDESGWRLLIETCLAQEDRVSALAEGQQLQRLLEAEERTSEPATQALLRRVNAQPEEKGRPDDGALVAELVGRERQFSALLTAFQQARGSARTVSVMAPAGLGKTRLLLDLARRLAASGTAAVYVRAQPGDRDIPGSYVAEVARLLASRPGARGVSPASAGSLVALDPSISGQFPALPDPSTGDEARRRRVAALAELIQSVSDEHPFALLLDDLHWADTYSRDVLEHTISHARGAQALFALAARPGGALTGVEADQSIVLEPLTHEQTEALVSSLGSLPNDPWAADFAAQLHAAAEGSPLLVLETLHLALETGALSRTDGTWTCPDEETLVALLKAGSALGRRIDQLDRPQGWLLLLLALGGTPLPAEALAVACGQDRQRTMADLMVLERRGLVARQADEWSVAHDEIAELAEAHADPRQRTAAHGALGRALLAASTDGAGLRGAARHLAAASLVADLAKAATAWVRRARANDDRRSARALVAELIGASPSNDAVRRLMRELPWGVRVNHPRRWAAAAAVAGLIVTGLVAAVARAGSDNPGVVIALWTEDAGGRWRLKAHELTERDIARGTVALASFKPTDLVSPTRPEGLIRPGSPGTLAATSAYPDSGGLDVVLSTDGGDRVTRITNRPGDDYARTWSPDGRYLAIATDRWAEHSRSNIAVLNPDQPDSPPVRLTSNPAARDEGPVWSPDGTRIAFGRSAYGSLPPELCLVSVDGSGEECLNPGPEYRSSGFSGWISPVELASAFVDSSGVTRILAVNSVTGEHREVAEGLFMERNHVAGWIACYCRRNEAEPFQALVFPAAYPDRAVRIEPSDPPPMLALFPARPPQSYLERLEIEGAERSIPVDGTYRLQLRGWDAAGKPTQPLAVRWTSSDTTVAAVDSTGMLRPRRGGRLRVTATAGGWRTTSVEVTIGAAEATTVTAEDWRDSIATRWVPFGTPKPVVVQTDRGAALAPNGDSTNVSGVYLRRRLPTDRGVGVDFQLSTPLTSLFWQNAHVLLMPAASLDVSTWDHQAGIMNWPAWRECGVHFPSGESEPAQRELLLSSGLSRPVTVPPAMASGQWTRLRLQFFPDGRCGVALDGVARAILDRRAPLGDSAMLLIHAYSHRARILVGHLEVWTGVRRDVDWDAVRRD